MNLLNKFVTKALLFFIIVFCGVLYSQNKIIANVTLSDAVENQPVKVEVNLYQGINITRVLFAYKTFGQSEFRVKEMEMKGRMYSYEIPADEVVPAYIEYFIKVETSSGETETFPLVEGNYAQHQVTAISAKDKELIILSPEKGSIANLDELFISVSLLNLSDNVKRDLTKIFIDGEDVTGKAVLSGDLLMLIPGNFEGLVGKGKHDVKIQLYDNDGNIYHEYGYNFTAVSGTEYEDYAQAFKYNVNLLGESRNERFKGNSVWYNNFKADFAGTYKNWDINANLLLTSEEKGHLQPYNRYSVSVKNNWLSLQAGDSYPVYPDLVIDGKRVRGFNGSINLGFFNIQTSIGETEKAIDGSILQYYSKNEAPLSSNIIAIDAAGTRYAEINPGTYKRTLFALRPSFGSGEKFQFGLSYLHSKDDVGSIKYGIQPQENVVVGSDLTFAFDNRNIVFTSQAAVSLKNSDITTGDLTDAQIDSLFATGSKFDADAKQIKDAKNILSKFITVNQFLGPLNPHKLSSFAAEAGVALNYFNNNLNVKYIYRGNEFNSFGRSFLRTDVKGINLIDRIRLYDNKIFVNLGFEKLEDNLQKTKKATTEYQVINTSVSYFPRTNFPNITLGYTRYSSENGLPVGDASQIDDNTNKFYISLSYDIRTRIQHRVGLNFSVSDRDDKTKNNLDSKANSLQLAFNSYWNKDLSSFVNLTYYKSEYQDLTIKQMIEYKYTSFSLGGRYSLLENKLMLEASLSPSFGDFKRQAFDLTASYYLIHNLVLDAQFRIYRIPDMDTDSIYGVALKYSL